MRVPFGTTIFERDRGGLPTLPVVNMFAEAAPTEETGLALQSRPGVTDRAANMGAGPVAQLFKGDGVIDGALYGISGGSIYRETVSLGVIDGTGPASIAGFEDKLFFNAGGTIKAWDGAVLTTPALPDSANAVKIVVGGSRLVYIRADTEKVYWSNVLSDTVGGLSFSSAEQQPDRLKDILFWSDSLLLFGSETVETHPNTGDPALPFQALEGRTFKRGIRATGCASLFGPTYAWVTDLNQVCIETPENIISWPGMEAVIEASATCRLFNFYLEGTELLGLRLDERFFVYSYRSRMWSEFTTYGEPIWVPRCFAGGVFGSATDGRTMVWGADWTDLGQTLERRFRGGLLLNAGGLTLDNFVIRTNPGETGFLTGDYADPSVEVRFSRDGGKTWGNWKPRSLGEQGRYRKSVHWAGCGMFSQPGMMFECRVSDPVDFRVSDARANEGFGGI